MAYPTGMLGLILNDIDQQMVRIKSIAQNRSTSMASRNTPSRTVIQLYTDVVNVRAKLSAAAATPGIADYAKDQKNDVGLDIVAEFNTVIAALDAVSSWIGANFPKDSRGYLLGWTLDVSGQVERQFAPAATTGLRAVLDALAATID